MSRNEYNKKVRELAINKKLDIQIINNKFYLDLKSLKEEHGIPPNFYVTETEISNLIDLVLDKGISGRLALNEYMASNNKCKKWRKDVSKQLIGNAFKKALNKKTNNQIIIKMKKQLTFNKHAVMSKKTLTGALSELYRQRNVSLLIDNLTDQVAQMKENLALKMNKAGATAQILELHRQGKSIRDIADATGLRKSTVHDRLQRALQRA